MTTTTEYEARMARWAEWTAKRKASIEALNLQAGDVLAYTEEVTRRVGSVTQRNFTMTITEVDGYLIKGINVNTGKPAKTYLVSAIAFALVARAA